MEIPLKIKEIIKNIEDLKIQGATAVAEAGFEGIKLYIDEYDKKDAPFEVFMADLEKMGILLVKARPNEPLARNGLKYLLNTFKIRFPSTKNIEEARPLLIGVMDEFLKILDDSKKKIVNIAVEEFADFKGVLTHCHSSTAENICKGIAGKKDGGSFTVVATETRPLYQGRITAKNLLEAGLDVRMIVDNGVTPFLAGQWNVPIDAVFIGCDEITIRGDLLNKVGSYQVALAAYYTSKPLYVVGTILKMDPSTIYDRPEIEMRDSKEVWKDAPAGLKIINPAFEIVPHQFVTGFVTEAGIIKPEEIEKKIGEFYDWIW